jgi:DNA ligase (NAD+)
MNRIPRPKLHQKLSLATLLENAGVNGIGRRNADLLADHFPTISKLHTGGSKHWITAGLPQNAASSLEEYLSDEDNRKALQEAEQAMNHLLAAAPQKAGTPEKLPLEGQTAVSPARWRAWGATKPRRNSKR